MFSSHLNGTKRREAPKNVNYNIYNIYTRGRKKRRRIPASLTVHGQPTSRTL